MVEATRRISAGERPVVYDEAVNRDYCKRLKNHLDAERQAKDTKWWDDYNSYLASPEWQDVRSRVLERDRHLCQGCLISPAEVVHHLTYAHVRHELLFELTSLCQACHARAHEVDAQ